MPASKLKTIRACPRCGRHFQATNRQHKFCSHRCAAQINYRAYIPNAEDDFRQLARHFVGDDQRFLMDCANHRWRS